MHTVSIERIKYNIIHLSRKQLFNTTLASMQTEYYILVNTGIAMTIIYLFNIKSYKVHKYTMIKWRRQKLANTTILNYKINLLLAKQCQVR